MEQLKYFLGLCIVGILGFLGRHQLARLDSIEKFQTELLRRQADTERDIAVLEAETKNMTEDISEIKAGINKLIEKLIG